MKFGQEVLKIGMGLPPQKTPVSEVGPLKVLLSHSHLSMLFIKVIILLYFKIILTMILIHFCGLKMKQLQRKRCILSITVIRVFRRI